MGQFDSSIPCTALATITPARLFQDLRFEPPISSLSSSSFQFQMVVPPELGFGAKGGVTGTGYEVKGGETLYYEVRLRSRVFAGEKRGGRTPIPF